MKHCYRGLLEIPKIPFYTVQRMPEEVWNIPNP
jgi:hypothetical protein